MTEKNFHQMGEDRNLEFIFLNPVLALFVLRTKNSSSYKGSVELEIIHFGT